MLEVQNNEEVKDELLTEETSEVTIANPEEDIAEPDIIDIQLTTPQVEKKKFRLNGDNDTIIELNVHDMGIVDRLKNTWKKMKDLDVKVNSLDMTPSEEGGILSEEVMEKATATLAELDKAMREQVDYLFNSPISDVAAPKGKCTMFDMVNGMFRYEHIIEVLSELYSNNLNKEFNKMRQNTAKHTSKYTKKKRH